MTSNNFKFDLLYPDVLGAITGGPRINLDELQVAVGVFPRQAYLNQPLEVIFVLQNMVDQSMKVRLAIQLPNTDKKGNPVVIDTPRPQVTLGLRPGEVGVLRVPVVAHPPTPPGKQFPIRIGLRYKAADVGNHIRPPDGGAPPSVLTGSPFKIQVLREVDFKEYVWKAANNTITVNFDIAPKRLPHNPQDLRTRYETLWATEHMDEELELARSHLSTARHIATGGGLPAYGDLLNAVGERFAESGLPLHPGEAKAIAKMMAYTVDEAPEVETAHMTLEETRWFQTLCQVLAHNESLADLERGELIATYLFDSLLYESILLGFKILEPKIHEDLGNETERKNYATRVLWWIAGHGQVDLNYAYLPLVLAGLLVSRLVNLGRVENPWLLIDDLNEAYRGRVRLAAGEQVVVFNMLQTLLKDAANTLNIQRIRRPG